MHACMFVRVCVCMCVSVSLYPVNHATFIRASVGVFTCTSLILPQPNIDTYNNNENNLKSYKNCACSLVHFTLPLISIHITISN